MKSKHTSIDLFAGCGGLSLGLENAGFETVFVNELHEDAMDTFLLNRPDLDKRVDRDEKGKPTQASEIHVLNIRDLTDNPKFLKKQAELLHQEHGEIDLVCGGPPCQGFSGLGIRKEIEHRTTTKGNSRLGKKSGNRLFADMAKVIEATSPKAFIFENVQGLLSAKWRPGGAKGGVWTSVKKRFRQIRTIPDGKGYIIQWAILQAKDYGVPQRRPRLIMIGLREDVYGTLIQKTSGSSQTIKRNQIIKAPLEASRNHDVLCFHPQPIGIPAPHPYEILDDLIDPNYMSGPTLMYPKYKSELTSTQKYFRNQNRSKSVEITEHEYSKHKEETRKAFDEIKPGEKLKPASTEERKKKEKEIKEYFEKNSLNILSNMFSKEEKIKIEEEVKQRDEKLPYIEICNEMIKKAKEANKNLKGEQKQKNKEAIAELQDIIYFRKKFSQRRLNKKWDENVGPNITITSAPDDLIHYEQPRILTVREWARMQTFPDYYLFKGKRTSGGERRSGQPWEGNFNRDLPKYTQIGNAVPVKMAQAIGEHLSELLKLADQH